MAFPACRAESPQWGHSKRAGSRYVRDIGEGKGMPPDEYLWNVFSINTGNVLVTRRHAQGNGTVGEHADEESDGPADGPRLELRDPYVPR